MTEAIQDNSSKLLSSADENELYWKIRHYRKYLTKSKQLQIPIQSVQT